MSDSIVDADARARALIPTCSFICAAPAGSGKTELLTQRFLTLLARVGQPESIIAITFTRKSAAEMRDRILSAIKQAVQQPRPRSQHGGLTWDLARQVLKVDKANQWSLLEMPSRLQIKTFDSLCSSLANSLPSHTSFSSPPLITENPDELYRAAAQALLQSLEADQPWSEAIAKLLGLMDNNTQKLESLLAAMLSRREAWLPILGSGSFDETAVIQALQKNLRCVHNEIVMKLIETIPRHHQHTLLELVSLAAANLADIKISSPIISCANINRASHLPAADEEGIQQWLGLTELLLKKDNNWRKTVDRRVGFPLDNNRHEKAFLKQKKQQCLQLIVDLSQQPGLLDLLLEMRYLPSAVYNEDQASLLYALIKILPVLTGYLQTEFEEANSIDFAEVSIKARLALAAMGSPTELALALDYKIQHLLVDEFQDVSSAQFELLTLLTTGWQLDDGRSVFFVGDPMQSIYSFRHANVGLFLQCSENGIGNIPLEPLHLSTNFRSQAAIVTWVNRVFSQSFPRQNDIAVGAVSYLPSEPIHTPLPQRSVWFHGFEGTDGHDEARKMLNIVRQSRLDNPEGRIAILVRNRRHAMHILPLLEGAGLTYRAVDLDALADNTVIQDLMSLTRALLYPADRIAWLSILRAPWCGLSLVDLEAIASFQRFAEPSLTLLQQLIKFIALQPLQENIADDTQGVVGMVNAATPDDHQYRLLSADGCVRLSRVAPVLDMCVAQTQRQSLRQWIEGAWIALGGPACVENNRDFKNAERYFSLLESLDLHALIKKHDVLQKAVQTLYAAPDPDSDDKLQIMTIHKAKGLEFDTVIIPALERSLRGSEPELLRWDERLSVNGEPLLLMSPITSSGKEKDSIYNYLALQDKRRRLNENTRLLYVACTRACHYLHLLAQVKTDKKDAMHLRQPAQSSLLYAAWPTLKSEIECHQKSEVVDIAKSTVESSLKNTIESPKHLQRLNSQWQMPPLKRENLLAGYVPYYTHDNDQFQHASWQDPTPRYVGVLVHQILQQCTLSDLQVSRWQQYRLHWRAQLQVLGVPSRSLEQATEKVIATLERVAADTSIHWLFAHNLQRKTEYPVTLASKKGVEHYVIDLLVLDGKNTWLVDYKTSQPEAYQEESQFIKNELTKYHAIMHRYRKVIDLIGYKNIRLALYFPMINYFAKY